MASGDSEPNTRQLWGTRSEVAASAVRSADGVRSAKISAFLEPVGRVEGLPKSLVENSGKAFQGCNVNGIGFTMGPDVAAG